MTADSEVKQYTLTANQMLRYEVTEVTVLKLVSGKAEIFGKELVIGSEITLEKDQRGTLLTFHGCEVHLSGKSPFAFTMNMSEDQDIPSIYLNIHANLEISRMKTAKDESERGPRVLICGYDSVGKTTLCTTLVNYAARKGHRPILVDVNVGLNQVCVPTTMCALAVSRPFDLKGKWMLEEDPIVYCFGHVDPVENLNLYREQINKLSVMVNIRSENDSKIFSSGCVINMAGFRKDDTSIDLSEQKGIQTIRATASAFEDGFLYEFLKNDFPDEVNVIKVPKSSGVVTRTNDQWMKQRDARVRAYFHGECLGENIHPFHLNLNIKDFEVYKIGSEAVPDALLPQGAEKEETWHKAFKVSISKELKNRVLAVSQASDPEQIPYSPIYGLMVVIDVNIQKEVFTVLSRTPQNPPNELLMVTGISYVDPEFR